MSTPAYNVSDFSYCMIRGLKNALVEANSEIRRLKETVWEYYRKYIKEESTSMARKIEFDKLEEVLRKKVADLQSTVVKLETELKDKNNENVNLNFKVKELKAFVEEKMKEIDVLREKNNKVQKPTSKEAYRTKYRILKRNLKTIIKNTHNKPDSKVLQDISSLIHADDEKEANLENYTLLNNNTDKISIQITLPDLLSLNSKNSLKSPTDSNQCQASSTVEASLPVKQNYNSENKLPDLLRNNEDLLMPVSDDNKRNYDGEENLKSESVERKDLETILKDGVSDSTDTPNVKFKDSDIQCHLAQNIIPVSTSDSSKVANDFKVPELISKDKRTKSMNENDMIVPLVHTASKLVEPGTCEKKFPSSLNNESTSIFEPTDFEIKSETIIPKLNSPKIENIVCTDKTSLCSGGAVNDKSISIFEPPEMFSKSEVLISKSGFMESEDVIDSDETKFPIPELTTSEAELFDSMNLTVSIDEVMDEMVIPQNVKEEMECFRIFCRDEVSSKAMRDSSATEIDVLNQQVDLSIQSVSNSAWVQFTDSASKDVVEAPVLISSVRMSEDFCLYSTDNPISDELNHNCVIDQKPGNFALSEYCLEQKPKNSSLKTDICIEESGDPALSVQIPDLKSQDLFPNISPVLMFTSNDEYRDKSLRSAAHKNLESSSSTFPPNHEENPNDSSVSFPVNGFELLQESKNSSLHNHICNDDTERDKSESSLLDVSSPPISASNDRYGIYSSDTHIFNKNQNRENCVPEPWNSEASRDDLKCFVKESRDVHPDVFEIINELTYWHRTALHSDKMFADFVSEGDKCVMINVADEHRHYDSPGVEYVVIAEVLPEDHNDTEVREELLGNQIICSTFTDTNLKLMELESMDLDQLHVENIHGEILNDDISLPVTIRSEVVEENSISVDDFRSSIHTTNNDSQSDIEEEDKLVIDEEVANSVSDDLPIRCDPEKSPNCDVPSLSFNEKVRNTETNSDCRVNSEEVIAKKFESVKSEDEANAFRYNLRQKTPPNFRLLSKGSLSSRKKKTGEAELCPESFELPGTANLSFSTPSNVPLHVVAPYVTNIVDVDMKPCFQSVMIGPDGADSICPNQTNRETLLDNSWKDDTTQNQKSCLPKFYCENPPEVGKPVISWMSPVDEIWSKIKYLHLEIPELDKDEEDNLVLCQKPITHMAFYLKKEKKSVSKVVAENLIKFDLVKKSLENYRREKNKNIAFANLTACISQSNKTTACCAIAAVITNSVDREVPKDVKIIHELKDLCIAIDKLLNGFLDSMKAYLKSQMFAKVFNIDENSGGLNMISCTILWSKFYAVLCARYKTEQDVEDVLNLVYDSLDVLKNRAHPIAYGVLTEWPEIFSYRNLRSNLLIPIMLFSLVHHRMSYNVHMYKTEEVQKLLGQLYGIRLGHRTAEQFAKEAMLKVDDPFWLSAVVLLCKRQMFPWTYTNVVMKYVLPILRKWNTEDFSETIMYKFLHVLKKIMLACPYEAARNSVYNLDSIVDTLSSILSSQKGSRKLKETVAVVLCELSTWRFTACSDLLRSWVPADGLISSGVLQKMKETMHDKRHRTKWIAFFAPASCTKSNGSKPNTRSSTRFAKQGNSVIPIGLPSKMKTLNNPIKQKKMKKTKKKKKKKMN